ncbi:PadR family transcriptional regulator [Ktedonosporobacter rubrisoli]|uniref:PadR family transcriptional regulator n=1 Tax=Ktedonosporobacter rubrisoli TaxID=2509675 RepID=A0A4V0YZM7_KTERU|nr:PadR family transcriptional regulator [Ktedonosporobacter rubrisoli]QBD80261.1 PadR family transcriptional regulator [Ktedonosporobacter rubrisoli]
MQISEPAEYAILGLLKGQPMHGYEMFQQFENGTLGQIVHLEMSQMYAFLKKLERLTYIEAELEPQGARPPRKIFHLTTTGQGIFEEWLSQAVQKPRDIRILFLIKLYFAQRYQPEQMPSLIVSQIQACQRFLAHLETQQHSETSVSTRASADDAAFFDLVVLRSRIYQTRSLLDWLYELQGKLASLHK